MKSSYINYERVVFIIFKEIKDTYENTYQEQKTKKGKLENKIKSRKHTLNIEKSNNN